MINKSRFPEYNLLTAKAVMDENYSDIKMDDDTFVEKAYYAWKNIGNRFSYLHVYEEDIPDNGELEIPDNVDSIETVTASDYFYNSYVNQFDNFFFYDNGSLLSSVSEIEKPVFQDERYNKMGPFVNYELHGKNKLHFDKALSGAKICVIYKGIISDEDCLPLINHREAEAIAHQVAYVETRRLARMGDKNMAQFIQIAKQEADTAMARAAIPEEINENLMDQVLNTKTSFDRKSYNRNFKFRK